MGLLPGGIRGAGRALLLATLLVVHACAAAPLELYLDVSLNGTPLGMVARFRTGSAGELYSSLQDLRALGIDTPVDVEGGAPTVVGHGGLVFVERARASNRLLLRPASGACQVNFRTDPAAAAAEPIGPMACVPLEGE